MKPKVKKTIMLTILILLGLLTTSPVFAAANSSINWTRFKLFRYNSGLYLDASVSNCEYAYQVLEEDDDGNMILTYESSKPSGTFRTWFNIPSNTTRRVELQCIDNNREAVYWTYKVWFKNGKIKVSRIDVGSKPTSP